jgi:uncharacterized repeat protein (TIGR02543 family)
MPVDPSRTHYVFDGWHTEQNGGGTEFTGSTTVSSTMTVYAKWMHIQCTVMFDADGGSPESQTITVNSGSSIGSANMPSDPSRTHYAFDGWYTEQNGWGTEFTASTTVSGSMTVYAKWTIIQYTVTFNANGGSPATQTRTVNSGSSIGSSNMPSDPVKSIYGFGGWYTAPNGGGTEFTASTTVNNDVTVYAKWMTLSLGDALTWISDNATTGGVYTLTLTSDETIAPRSLSYGNRTVSVTIMGDNTERTIDLSSNGALFTIENGVTLTLGNNVTLQGRSGNDTSLVKVNNGGTLVMNAGAKITGNATSSSGGGVYVYGGTFIMNDGTISGNISSSPSSPSGSSSYGGGVFVSEGIFVMNNGTISGNTSTAFYTSSRSYGGGVCVSDGTFTMNNGTINGNTSLSLSADSSYGGGVYVIRGTFTMSGGFISDNTASDGGGVILDSSSNFNMSDGSISDNTASSSGGGVYMSGGTFTMSGGFISDNTASAAGGVHMSGGTFTMSGGSISDNTASSSGGGVYVLFGTFTMNDGSIGNNTASSGGGVEVFQGGTFSMNDGSISGNTASSFGGGVFVYAGGFTMSGGAISGNTADSGGGVCVDSSGTFVKQQSGGTIYGSNESDNSLRNTANDGNSYGHAVYTHSGAKRNTTAGAGVALEYSVDGTTGGWE